MITLDEAIKCEKNVSEAHGKHLISGFYKRGSRAEEECRKCAEYHRLLACWLTDLKRMLIDEGLREEVLKEEGLWDEYRDSVECMINYAEDCVYAGLSVKEGMNKLRDKMLQDENVRNLRKRHMAFWEKRIKMKEDWIPTTKRLPEKDDVTFVLLTINGCKGIVVRSGWYYDGGFHSDTGDYYRMDNKKDAEMVLAWMPQPEPYIKDWRKNGRTNKHI